MCLSEKSHLLLRVSPNNQNCETVGNRFYTIDLTYHSPDDQYAVNLEPFSETPPGTLPSKSSCVVSDSSIIYLFGGRRFAGDEFRSPVLPCREVYYFDTRSPEPSWKVGPSMIADVTSPCCQVVNGYIYAMHGYAYPKASNTAWGGVFDPILNEWSILPSPCNSYDEEENFISSSAVYGGDNHLLLLSPKEKTLYLYDLRSKSWEVFADNFHLSSSFGYGFSCPFAVVDDMLYYFDRKLRAYDLINRKPVPKSVKGLDFMSVSPPLYDHPERNHPRAFVVHLGNGNLCLVWTEEYYSWRLHCTKFRVSKHGDGGGDDEIVLHAIIQSCAVYYVGDSITDCFSV